MPRCSVRVPVRAGLPGTGGAAEADRGAGRGESRSRGRPSRCPGTHVRDRVRWPGSGRDGVGQGVHRGCAWPSRSRTGATASRGGWCVEKRAGGKAAVLAGDPGALPVAGPCPVPAPAGPSLIRAVGAPWLTPLGLAARLAAGASGARGRAEPRRGSPGPERAWRVVAWATRVSGRPGSVAADPGGSARNSTVDAGGTGWGPAARGPGPSSTPARAGAARRRRAGVPGEGCPRAAGCRRGGSHGCAARRRGSARPPSAGWSPSRPTGEGWGGGRATARRSKGSRTAPRRGPAV
ncbi:hypothetical protein EES47_23595 [Streptomyces sp. ADI98-12]|nr:hypothetical protein [Streptomyces sp. DSM 41037]RPK84528.1 hypothetical protein EES47_23595 [Streptomyces sp. ADI98-12]